MCRFKSGIILKSRVAIAPGGDDSHSTLLKNMGIIDDYINASKVFVRAELVPKNNEWWINPEEYPNKWTFVVDQDIVPDWFDKEEDEKVFRESVCDWWKQHVLIDQKIDELSSGYYCLKRCEVKILCKDVQVMLDNSTVQVMLVNSTVNKMLDNSTVNEMWNSSTVNKMWGNSTVNKMLDNSTVNEMLDNSTVNEMWDSSTVNEMWGNSTVNEMRDNSTVNEMRGSSTVNEMWGSSTVNEMRGNSMVRSFKEYPKIQIFVPDTEKFEMVSFKNNSED